MNQLLDRVTTRLKVESDSYAKAIVEGIQELDPPMEKPVVMSERETIIFRMGVKQGCDKASGMIVLEKSKLRKKRTTSGLHLL